MRKKISALIGVFVLACAGVLALTGGSASAAPPYPCSYTYFCVHSDTTGGVYSNAGSSSAWPSAYQNHEDWVENNGSPGGASNVDIFYATGPSGAYACISTGTQWILPGAGYIFSWIGVGGTSGHNQNILNNAAAHLWTSGGCGNYNY